MLSRTATRVPGDRRAFREGTILVVDFKTTGRTDR